MKPLFFTLIFFSFNLFSEINKEHILSLSKSEVNQYINNNRLSLSTTESDIYKEYFTKMKYLDNIINEYSKILLSEIQNGKFSTFSNIALSDTSIIGHISEYEIINIQQINVSPIYPLSIKEIKQYKRISSIHTVSALIYYKSLYPYALLTFSIFENNDVFTVDGISVDKTYDYKPLSLKRQDIMVHYYIDKLLQNKEYNEDIRSNLGENIYSIYSIENNQELFNETNTVIYNVLLCNYIENRRRIRSFSFIMYRKGNFIYVNGIKENIEETKDIEEGNIEKDKIIEYLLNLINNKEDIILQSISNKDLINIYLPETRKISLLRYEISVQTMNKEKTGIIFIQSKPKCKINISIEVINKSGEIFYNILKSYIEPVPDK